MQNILHLYFEMLNIVHKFVLIKLSSQLKTFKNTKFRNTMSKILAPDVKAKLSSEQTKMKIALELEIAYVTLIRWLKTNHRNLTLDRTKEVFSKHTGVPVEDLFEKQHA